MIDHLGHFLLDFLGQIWTQWTLRHILGPILVIFEICVVAANSLTRKDHDLEAVTGEPGKLFQPVCICEESEWRPVRTLVSVPVSDPVRFQRSGSSGC